MKYVISFQGYEVEVIIAKVTEKMFNHFKDNHLNVTDHMCGNMEDELSEEISGGICFDTKFDMDHLYHKCGPIMDESVKMIIINLETEEIVFSCTLDEIHNTVECDAKCEQGVYLTDFDARCILVGELYSKGYIGEYVLELKDSESFDPSKLTLLYNDIDENYSIITGVEYNNVDLECTGDLSSIGKVETWYIQDNLTLQKTIEE